MIEPIVLAAFIPAALAGPGLSAIAAAQPGLFDAIRWVGVAYLLWLAWGALRGPVPPEGALQAPPAHAFHKALLVNLTNPRVILFVLAFVPQFVVPENGAVLAQFLILGAILSAGGFVVNGTVGVFAGGLGRRLARSPKPGRGIGYVSAAIFTSLALRLAFMQRT